MITLSLAIMHAAFHPQRRSLLTTLMRSLGGLQTIQKRTTAFKVVEDWTKEGPWPTARRAWLEGVTGRASHHLVLQDDVAVCPDFFRHVLSAITACPNEVISLYANSKKAEEARDAASAWACISQSCWGQGLIVPTNQINPFLRWEAEHFTPTYPHDDDRLVLYLLSKGAFVHYTVPSLVQHLGVGVSLLGHNNPIPQRARVFIAAGEEPDWSKGLPLATPNKLGAFNSYLKQFAPGAFKKVPIMPLPQENLDLRARPLPYKLLEGDLEQGGVEKLLDGAKVDHVYTDPPWGLGLLKWFRTHNEQKDEAALQDWPRFLHHLATAIRGAIKPASYVFIDMGDAWVDDVQGAMGVVGIHEIGRYTATYQGGGKTRPYTVWLGHLDPKAVRMPDPPAGLPYDQMVRYGLGWATKPGEVILDVCCGKGSIAKVAYQQGLRYYGLELNPKRLAETEKLLKRLTSEKKRG